METVPVNSESPKAGHSCGCASKAVHAEASAAAISAAANPATAGSAHSASNGAAQTAALMRRSVRAMLLR